MVGVGDKHNVFRFNNKDYTIEKKNHKLPTTIIIDISPLLMKENHNLLDWNLGCTNKKSMTIAKCIKWTQVKKFKQEVSFVCLLYTQ